MQPHLPSTGCKATPRISNWHLFPSRSRGMAQPHSVAESVQPECLYLGHHASFEDERGERGAPLGLLTLYVNCKGQPPPNPFDFKTVTSVDGSTSKGTPTFACAAHRSRKPGPRLGAEVKELRLEDE